MLQCQVLFNEAESLFAHNQQQLALESFQTLLTLLEDQRNKDKTLINQVKRYIECIKDPIAFKASQQRLQQTAKNNEQSAEQQRQIDEVSKSANDYYQAGHFEMAGNRYSQLINLLTESKPRKSPLALGHAYWNFAMSNISWASQLQLTAADKAQLLKDQAKLQIQEAMLAYPSSAKKHLNACQSKLTELTTFLVNQEQSQSIIDVEEISNEVEIVKNPPVLFWKKALLQRYLLEQQNAIIPVENSKARERPVFKS